ncbi:uncharacterized protein RCC_07358 [Ramularia collo-cygni]|uniref:Uncharacterized protein n=1 Tax=Ramularia collo-cygni TaxID=112498 RepID=A0A2D3V489_9PEZI|nr:uncharacterized protein RCC_07358 [Ramularia collo-cygni]CZT21495.1 uncharacterized protein RCC_07358 [Ramularia collo-cygni]
MPINWDAAAEAKLMAAIFTVCEVKVSQPQLKQLATMMGSDCTPKAITHRLAKLRKAGGETTPQAKEDVGEPKAKKAKTTPVKKPARQTTKKARAETPIDSDDDEEAGVQPTPPATLERPQRKNGVKRSYDETSIKEEVIDDEDEDDGITVGEDIGQGLRAVRKDYKSEAEDSEMSEALDLPEP